MKWKVRKCLGDSNEIEKLGNMERMLQEEREKSSKLMTEVTKYSTMVEEKNELISNLRQESDKYKQDYENLNNVILAKITELLNKPDGQPQNMDEIRKLLSSVNKLDQDISLLRENNQEIISKHENNFYHLKDQLNKATDEIRNSKKVETVTKTIIQAPMRERVVSGPPIRKRVISNPPIQKRIIRASRSPSRVYRETPVRSNISYSQKCNCNCVNSNVGSEYNVEKCPICKVGLVNTYKSNSRLSAFQNQSMHSNLFTEKLTGKSYQKHSPEKLKNSMFSNQYYVKNSNVMRENPVSSRMSARYSVEPKRISHTIRKSNNPRISVNELDPVLVSRNVNEFEKVKNVEVRKSVTRT
jgi:hypothetical protein